jgi:hypothetical protein
MSLLFGVLSLAFIVHSWKTAIPWTRDLSIFTAGMFAMLANFTKLHALPYLALLLLFTAGVSTLAPDTYKTNDLNSVAQKPKRFRTNVDEWVLVGLLLILGISFMSSGAKKFGGLALATAIAIPVSRRFASTQIKSDALAKAFYALTGVWFASVVLYISLLPLKQPSRWHFWVDVMNSATGLGHAYKAYKTPTTIAQYSEDVLRTIGYYYENYHWLFAVIAFSFVIALWKRTRRDFLPAALAVLSLAYCLFAVIRYASSIYWIYYDVFLALAVAMAIFHISLRLGQGHAKLPMVIKILLFALVFWNVNNLSNRDRIRFVTNADGRADVFDKETKAIDPSFEFGRHDVKRYFECPDCTSEFNQIAKDKYQSLETFLHKLSQVSDRSTRLPLK